MGPYLLVMSMMGFGLGGYGLLVAGSPAQTGFGLIGVLIGSVLFVGAAVAHELELIHATLKRSSTELRDMTADRVLERQA